MTRILITGATGNIGYQVVRFLTELEIPDTEVIAGVRDVGKAQRLLGQFPRLAFQPFDFEQPGTFSAAFSGADRLFLLRPPHISDVGTYFEPLVRSLQEQALREVVFLSVQGAEASSVIPHNKIEKLLRASGADYVFLRPGYFMQNLTTTLRDDIQLRRRIFLPAGKARFNWIDAEDIGAVAARVLADFPAYRKQAFDLTGEENLGFGEVAAMIREVLGEDIRYESPSLMRFYWAKRREGIEPGLIWVMLLLHYLPRFQAEPPISGHCREIMGKAPTRLRDFLLREREQFRPR
jgi:uncharacterized protein YbjT (DUF2867 family)